MNPVGLTLLKCWFSFVCSADAAVENSEPPELSNIMTDNSTLLPLFQIEALPMRSVFWSTESEAHPQRRALWSAENEALPQRKAFCSAESEAKNHGKISILPTFLLNFDYELLRRSLHSNNVSIPNTPRIV